MCPQKCKAYLPSALGTCSQKKLSQTENSVAYEVTQSNQISGFRIFYVYFVSKGNHFRILFYSTVAGVVPCGSRKKFPRSSS